MANQISAKKNSRVRPMRQLGPLTEKEVAQYTADMMLELRQLCKNSNLTTIQTLIELVYYEAFATANPVAIPEEELERLRYIEREGMKSANRA
jgi:hypothetical protein